MNDVKKIPAIAATVDHDAMTLVITGANGEQLSVYANELSDGIRNQALLHGLRQKIVDAAAISRNPDTGRSASIADKFAAMRAVVERLSAGAWNAGRGEGSGGSGGLLFRALVRMYEGKKSPEDIREYLDGKTKAEQAALRKNAKIAAVIDEIKAESAGDDDSNADDLLAELDD